jgi:hypothetical protein
MKKIAIVALALLALTQIAGAVEYTGAFSEVKAQSVSQNKPILMEFFADW